MDENSNCEELRQRIRSQKKLIAGLERKLEALQESEAKAKTIFENANDVIVYVGVDGSIVDVNDKCEDILGYRPEAVIGKKFWEFEVLSPETMQKSVGIFQEILGGESPPMLEIEAFRKERDRIYIEVNCRIIKKAGEVKGVLTIIRDVTERKLAAKELRKHHDHLEELVKERTINLEEANTALKVLLKKRDEDKKELEEKVLLNISNLVFPYLEALADSGLNGKKKAQVDIIKANLDDIVAPFIKGLSSKHLKLTPTEIKIANLIRHGKTTKEISSMWNLSIKTIEFHRENIRKKLGIHNKKVNLRTYLLSMK